MSIESLPVYAAFSRFFVVIAPPVIADGVVFNHWTYAQRGWCRLELAADTLSPIAKPLIVAQSLNQVESYPAKGLLGMGFLHSPVCKGDFSDAKDHEVP